MSEEIQKTYHAVEKNGIVAAIWEMEGAKHVRTIDPRSREGQTLLSHYTPEAEASREEIAMAASNGEK